MLLPASRPKVSLGWWTWVMLVAVIVLLICATAFPVAQETWWSIFSPTCFFGIAIAYCYYAWGRGRYRGSICDWDSFWEASAALLLPPFWRGTAAGVAAFSMILLINGLFGDGVPYRVRGVVAAKDWSSSKSGRSYHIDIRNPQDGLCYRRGVSAVQYELTQLGAEQEMTLRTGLLGWPYRVR